MKAQDFYNPFVKLLLRSPLHGLMSGGTLLLTFAGRRSGRPYTTPVSYARDGNSVTLITNRQHGWWRNLRGGAPVQARLKGRDLSGTARVVEAGPAAVLAAVQTVYRGIPPARAAQLVPEAVLIAIELD